MQPEEKERLLKYLYDALLAAKEIVTYESLSHEQFQFPQVKWIVERGIEIISEALKRSVNIKPDLKITDMNKIFATRNRIAHEYDIVDPYLLYTVVKKHIPYLIDELTAIIDEIEKV